MSCQIDIARTTTWYIGLSERFISVAHRIQTRPPSRAAVVMAMRGCLAHMYMTRARHMMIQMAACEPAREFEQQGAARQGAAGRGAAWATVPFCPPGVCDQYLTQSEAGHTVRHLSRQTLPPWCRLRAADRPRHFTLARMSSSTGVMAMSLCTAAGAAVSCRRQTRGTHS